MASSLTSCPRCMQTCSPLGLPGTSSFSFNMFWHGLLNMYVDIAVYNPGSNVVVMQVVQFPCANVFHTLKQLRDHARHWHVQHAAPTDNIIVLNNFHDTTLDIVELDDIQQLNDTSVADVSFSFCFANKGTAQFAELWIAGTVSQATHCLV
jgi:hypothetical protein